MTAGTAYIARAGWLRDAASRFSFKKTRARGDAAYPVSS